MPLKKKEKIVSNILKIRWNVQTITAVKYKKLGRFFLFFYIIGFILKYIYIYINYKNKNQNIFKPLFLFKFFVIVKYVFNVTVNQKEW